MARTYDCGPRLNKLLADGDAAKGERVATRILQDSVEISDDARRAAAHLEAISMAPERFDEFTGGFEHQSEQKPDRVAEVMPQSGIKEPLVSDEQFAEAMRRAKLAVNGSWDDRVSFRLWLETIALVGWAAGGRSVLGKFGEVGQ